MPNVALLPCRFEDGKPSTSVTVVRSTDKAAQERTCKRIRRSWHGTQWFAIMLQVITNVGADYTSLGKLLPKIADQ